MEEILEISEHKMGIPYSYQDRGTSINHGFFNLRKNPEIIPTIPEIQEWPQMIPLLQAINRFTGVFWSLACGTGVVPFRDEEYPHLKTKAGCYFDVAFAYVPLNIKREKFQRLATMIREFGSTYRIAKFSDAYMKLREVNYTHHNLIGWCLDIDVEGYGASEEEARAAWFSIIKPLTDFFSRDWPSGNV